MIDASEAVIRRLLQAMDLDLLTTAIGVWLAGRAAALTSTGRRAIAVDGETLRGSRTADNAADHVVAACDQATGVVLASTDVDGKTNEITRFGPLLDQISDLCDTVITADALHCQREHVSYLAERGAHWIRTVKGNQPTLHAQLAGLPWQTVPDARPRRRSWARPPRDPHPEDSDRLHRHGLPARRPSHADPAPAGKARRAETLHHRNGLRHHRLQVHQARPHHLAGWIRGHWSIENKIHWVRDVTYDEDRSQIRTDTGAQVMAVLRNAAIVTPARPAAGNHRSIKAGVAHGVT